MVRNVCPLLVEMTMRRRAGVARPVVFFVRFHAGRIGWWPPTVFPRLPVLSVMSLSVRGPAGWRWVSDGWYPMG